MLNTTLIQSAAQALQAAVAARPRPVAFIGMDGFVDEIIRVVDKRTSFTEFTPVRTITDYANRLAAAAGKSTNVEFVIQEVKMGGNGPLMSDAVGSLGTIVNYVGALGHPTMNPTFSPLTRHGGKVVSIANPGVTAAAEFDDGKIMHGKMEGLAEITWENFVARAGGLGAVDELLGSADLLGLVNWTMIPHLTSVMRAMSARLETRLESGQPGGPRIAFFDLCDPEKRTAEDVRECMRTIASFGSKRVTAILGLNEKESQEICRAMNVDAGNRDHAGLVARARRIAEATGINEIVIHPRECAAAWGRAGEGVLDGPLCERPRLTTGAGDHFNGGYAFGRLMGLPPAQALVVGKAVSGFYVRQGRGPSALEVVEFCERWVAGRLD